MAKLDTTDIPSFYMNPSAYTNAKEEVKKRSQKNTGIRRGSKTEFSSMLDDLRGKTTDEIGPLLDLPVSENTINLLMDDVRSTGDSLASRPFPDEIMRYKQAVRNFLNYVVQNSYTIEYEDGILNKYKPSFKKRRNTPEAENRKRHTILQVIDRKLEGLAAMLISSQLRQFEIVSRLDEIRGLLIDLMQ
jgi:uncharacterized protein YaaR (DUF327 family)